MRVLLTSTMYPGERSPWRGAFIRNMVFALARAPETELAVWAPPGELPPRAVAVATAPESRWLEQLVEAGGISHVMRTGGMRALLAPFRLLAHLASVYRRRADVDVYHVNWLQCILPLPANGKPLLVTVLGNDLRLLDLPLMPTLLRRAMRGREVAICPNAEWMQDKLDAAFGDVAEVQTVSFGIDPVWYAVSRPAASQRPGRWLVVARLTREKLGPLFEWSAPLFADGGRELHLLGPMEQDVDIPDWVRYHGPATPEQLATEWFPNASGLITLSRHAEGRPQVMLEAMAAGLPIIASRTPAHATVVADRETGLLCDSPASYADALAELEDPATNARFGNAARARVSEEMGTWDDCAKRYLRVYSQLLDAGHRG